MVGLVTEYFEDDSVGVKFGSSKALVRGFRFITSFPLIWTLSRGRGKVLGEIASVFMSTNL